MKRGNRYLEISSLRDLVGCDARERESRVLELTNVSSLKIVTGDLLSFAIQGILARYYQNSWVDLETRRQ